MNESEPIGEADCGCSEKKAKRNAALAKGRAARLKKRNGREVFKDTMDDLACRCRDEFGNCYPCGDARSRKG